MRVNIDEIKEGGLKRAWDLAREAVDEMVKGDNAGYRAKGLLHVDARLTRMERRVLFEGHARAMLAAPCGRCLSPAAVEVPVDFQMSFVPDEEVHTRGEDAEDDRPDTRVRRRFAAEAVNEETYSGKVIDLDPVVREQLLLALPGYPVCQEGCKGLCSVCGANLNERECGCDRRVLDPRWAGLEKLKKPEKE